MVDRVTYSIVIGSNDGIEGCLSSLLVVASLHKIYVGVGLWQGTELFPRTYNYSCLHIGGNDDDT